MFQNLSQHLRCIKCHHHKILPSTVSLACQASSLLLTCTFINNKCSRCNNNSSSSSLLLLLSSLRRFYSVLSIRFLNRGSLSRTRLNFQLKEFNLLRSSNDIVLLSHSKLALSDLLCPNNHLLLPRMLHPLFNHVKSCRIRTVSLDKVFVLREVQSSNQLKFSNETLPLLLVTIGVRLIRGLSSLILSKSFNFPKKTRQRSFLRKPNAPNATTRLL